MLASFVVNDARPGGGGRIRTYEGLASGFTVRPLCRSGHSPVSPDTCKALAREAGARLMESGRRPCQPQRFPRLGHWRPQPCANACGEIGDPEKKPKAFQRTCSRRCASPAARIATNGLRMHGATRLRRGFFAVLPAMSWCSMAFMRLAKLCVLGGGSCSTFSRRPRRPSGSRKRPLALGLLPYRQRRRLNSSPWCRCRPSGRAARSAPPARHKPR